MIKIALTDDHEMVLKGLQQMLTDDPGITITGVYPHGKALLEGLRQEEPDILLLDLQLPDYSGEELARQVLTLYPRIKIMVLSSIDETKRVREMMRIGCHGYSLKNVSQTTLIAAIHKIQKGQQYMDPAVQGELVRELWVQENIRSRHIPEVTRREKEILLLLAEGCSSKDIADRLSLSIRTVENHRKSLLQKFDVKNAVTLLKTAKELGVLEGD